MVLLNIHQKSRRMIPNVSCFVQSVFSLMTSSPFEVVQCEAAALLVELTSHPQVLEVIIDYQYILFFRFSEIVLSSFPLRRLRSFEMARKGINTPLKKLRSAEVSFFLSRDSRADIL